MWYQWGCGGCDHTVWAPDIPAITAEMRSHLRMHYRQKLATESKGIQHAWECPYCSATGVELSKDDASEAFENHLAEHVPAVLDGGVTMADAFGSPGVLLYARRQATVMDRLRKQLFFEADSLVVVTSAPDDRVHVLSEQLPIPPPTTVLTTNGSSHDAAGVAGVDGRIEITKLNDGIKLTELAKEIAEATRKYEDVDGTSIIEFDILGAVLERFGVKPGFKFVNTLSTWADDSGSEIYYPVSPARQPASVLNVVEGAFSQCVLARDGVVRAGPTVDPK